MKGIIIGFLVGILVGGALVGYVVTRNPDPPYHGWTQDPSNPPPVLRP